MATIEQIRQILVEHPELGGLDGMDDVAPVDAIQALLPLELVERWANERTIVSVLGPTAGEAFMQGLETAAQANPILARALRWLKDPQSGGVNLADTVTRMMLDQLALAGVLSSGSVQTLKSLAEQPPTITHIDVARARGRLG